MKPRDSVCCASVRVSWRLGILGLVFSPRENKNPFLVWVWQKFTNNTNTIAVIPVDFDGALWNLNFPATIFCCCSFFSSYRFYSICFSHYPVSCIRKTTTTTTATYLQTRTDNYLPSIYFIQHSVDFLHLFLIISDPFLEKSSIHPIKPRHAHIHKQKKFTLYTYERK